LKEPGVTAIGASLQLSLGSAAMDKVSWGDVDDRG
jgi:hypothetical protein